MARKRKNPDPDYYNPLRHLPGIGPGLAHVRETDRNDPGRFLRAAGRTGSDEEKEADLLFEVRREAILDEARENGIGFDLADCFAKDLDALQAKLAASPLSAAGAKPSPGKQSAKGEQSEITEAFCQAHFARVVDLAQAGPVMVMRQGQPLLVVLSAERYAALSTDRPASQPEFGEALPEDAAPRI